MRVAFMNEYGGAVKKIYKNTRVVCCTDFFECIKTVITIMQLYSSPKSSKPQASIACDPVTYPLSVSA